MVIMLHEFFSVLVDVVLIGGTKKQVEFLYLLILPMNFHEDLFIGIIMVLNLYIFVG